MGEELLNIVRIDVPCSSCGEMDSQTVSDLIANNHIACGFCGNSIDVSAQEWRTLINETAESLRQITVTVHR